MKFMVLVPGNADSEAGVMPTEAELAEMGAYNEELANAGVMLSGEGLHPTSRGRRIVFGESGTQTVDGPFAESKELIAGFWIWECESLDAATEWAAKAPFPAGTELQIRQIFDAEDFGDEFTPELREQEERIRAQISQD